MTEDTNSNSILEMKQLNVWYGAQQAVRNINLQIPPHRITALIGPSGCGKSTVIRCFNRMNDLIPSVRVEGDVLYHQQSLYAPDVDPVEVRRRIGMVFQKPNPFPKSIYDNVAFGPRINGMRGNMDEFVEKALIKAALWDEVKDKLRKNRHGSQRRPAATPLYRPRAGGGAGNHPDG